jgi:Flp pilus assembly protein TadG
MSAHFKNVDFGRLGEIVSRRWSGAAKACRSEKATAVVEFAVAMPVLLVLSIGAVDYGSAVNVATKINNAARAAAQYGVYHPADTCGIVASAKNATNLQSISGVSSFAVKAYQGPTTSTDVTTCSSATAPVAYYCTCSSSGATAVNCVTGSCTSPAYKSYYVAITVSATYTPSLSVGRLPFVGSTGISSSIPMKGYAAIAFQ